MLQEKHENDIRVIVACMPKSGSTFLFTLLSNLPGMRKQRLVPGFKRREQEICLKKLSEADQTTKILRKLWRNEDLRDSIRPLGFVAHMHLRYSKPTKRMLNNFQITPIVLVRDIFDIVASLSDHLRDESKYLSMAYVNEEMMGWDEPKMQHFIADMVVPWYLNFYMCWQERENVKTITYEQMVDDVMGTVRDVAQYAGIPCDRQQIISAIEKTGQSNTRKNKAVVGRGRELPDTVKDKIRHLASYYPQIDFSRIGL